MAHRILFKEVLQQLPAQFRTQMMKLYMFHALLILPFILRHATKHLKSVLNTYLKKKYTYNVTTLRSVLLEHPNTIGKLYGYTGDFSYYHILVHCGPPPSRQKAVIGVFEPLPYFVVVPLSVS